MVPMISADAPLGLFGGVLAVVYLLGLGRFFLALGGLDTGSSFGGLGSSREMTISALAEPAMMLAVFTVAIGADSTSLSEVAKAAIGAGVAISGPVADAGFCGAVRGADRRNRPDSGGQSGHSPGTHHDPRGHDPGVLRALPGPDRMGRIDQATGPDDAA